MVSQDPADRSSRRRLLEAAAAEFAARGFDGAKVARIGARAGMNKAMLYYHFKNKAGLYREILRDVFGAAADAAETVAGDMPPDAQLAAFVRAIGTTAVAAPHFPPIWLRELADGGRHLDAPVVAQIQRVMRRLEAILRAGRRAGRFREVHPLIVQMSIVAPLLLFAASAPVRRRLRVSGLTPEAVREYVQIAALSALEVRPPARRRSHR